MSLQFFSQEQIAEFQGVFNLLDQQKRGTLDFESLKAGMIAMRLHPKDQDVRNMIKEADTSKTGTIDFKGFVDCLSNKLMKMDNEDEILKAFNTFDRNDRGVIPADELRKSLTTLGDKLTEKEIREVLKEGSDADGHFDYEKFVKLMTGKIHN